MISPALVLALTLSFTPDASRWSGALLVEAQTPRKMTLALPGLQGADISKEKTDFFTAHFSTQLQRLGLNVTSAEDIAAAIGLERQKQLLGCTDDTTCMTEIASALGADGIITGKLAKLGNTYAANMKVIEAKSGKAIALFSATVESEALVLEMLNLGAKEINNQLRALSPGTDAPTTATKAATARSTTEPDGLRTFGRYTMVAGTGVAVVSLLTLLTGAAVYLSGDEVRDVDGTMTRSTEGTAVPLMGVGLLGGLVGTGVFVLGVICYFIGEDKVVPAKQALLRHTPFNDVAFGFSPGGSGGTARVAFRF